MQREVCLSNSGPRVARAKPPTPRSRLRIGRAARRCRLTAPFTGSNGGPAGAAIARPAFARAAVLRRSSLRSPLNADKRTLAAASRSSVGGMRSWRLSKHGEGWRGGLEAGPPRAGRVLGVTRIARFVGRVRRHRVWPSARRCVRSRAGRCGLPLFRTVGPSGACP